MSDEITPNPSPTPEVPPAPEMPPASVSHQFAWWITAGVALIVLLLVFQLGVFVGFHKAGFSYAWGENYHRVFGGPGDGLIHDFEDQDYINGHGTAGSIAKIDGNDIIIEGSDGVEKTVVATTTTTIREGSKTTKVSNLKVGETIVVIGAPQSDGTINAEIIRVFDTTSSSSSAPAPSQPNLPNVN